MWERHNNNIMNAKELVLSKINCGPDMAGIWAYFIINGFDMNDIGELMISNVVNTISTLSRADRLQGNHVSINSIIRDIERGKVSFGNYFPYTWFHSIFKVITDIARAERINIPETSTSTSSDEVSKLEQLEAFTKKDLNHIIRILQETTNNNINIGSSYATEDGYGLNVDENGKAKLLRYLNSLVLYKELHNKYTVEPGVSELTQEQYLFENFKSAVEAADELTISGQLLGINQGIKTDLEGRLKFLHNFDKMFSKIRENIFTRFITTTRVDDIPEEDIRNIYTIFRDDLPGIDFNEDPKKAISSAFIAIRDTTTPLKSSFNLHRFLTEPEYKEAIIKEYSYIQRTINPFELVSEMANYNSFLEVFDTNEIIFKLASVKYSLFNNIRNKLSFKYKPGIPLNDNDITRINNYIDKILIQKWFKSLGDKSEFKLKKGWKYFNNEGNLVEVHDDNTTINLNNIHGIASFKYMMDNYIIPLLQKGIVLNKNFKEDTNSAIANNDFIKNLIVTDREDLLTNENYEYYRLGLDIINTENNPNYDKALNGFTLVSNVEMIGHSLVDLFSIYTLIVHKGKMGQDSLLRLLQGAVYNNNNLINNYYNYIGDIDINTIASDFKYIKDADKVSENDIDLDDILIELSPVEGTFAAYQSKNAYTRVLDKNTDTYIIYKTEINENNEVSKNKIYLPGSDSNYYLFRNYVDSYIKPTEIVATEADGTIEITDKEFKKMILDAIANLKMTYDVRCHELLLL